MVNITIGQYYPTKSIIHRLDPRVGLLAVAIWVTMLFFVTNFVGYAFAALCLTMVIKLSQVPPKFMFRGLKGIVFILMFTVVLNIFFVPGEIILFQYGILKVTYEGLIQAAQMGIRLILLLIGCSLLTLTTSPIQLTNAIENALKPLKKIGVPSHEIAMMMTIALRFIPTLLEELDKIMKAQTARGADFETGNIAQKAKSLIPILVPLFISSFRRADELAMAMEARCYRGDIDRTRMKALVFKKRDYIAVVILILFSAVILLTRLI